MQRLLTTSLLCIVATLLAACWHEAFHASIENGTNQKIYVVIHFDDQLTPIGHGYVEPGNGVNLPQMVENISYIEYTIGNRRCRLDKKLIAQAARTRVSGVTSIILRDCGS